MPRFRRRPRFPDRVAKPDFPSDAVTKPSSSRLRVVGLKTELDRMAAIYALRVIRRGKLQSKMIMYGRIVDSELLELTGLVEPDECGDDLTPSVLNKALDKQAARLEKLAAPKLARVRGNIARIGDMVRLDAAEREILLLAFVASQVGVFSALFDNLWPTAVSQAYSLLGHATGHSVADIERACGPTSRLRVLGFLMGSFGLSDSKSILSSNDRPMTMLSARRFDPKSLLRHIVRQPAPPTLSLVDYEHLPDLPMMRRYLTAVTRDRLRGVNFLIHGNPGTGKSAFVAAISAACGLTLQEIPTEDEDGDPINGAQRLRTLVLANQFLSDESAQLLLFDEVEDVFGKSDDDVFGWGRRSSAERMTKGAINHLLEENPVPTIWVSNGIHSIDPAHLRRFDLVVEFRQPTSRVRRRIIDNHFPKGVLSETAKDTLARMERLPPARVERAARVVKALRSSTTTERDAEALQVAELSLAAMGAKRPPRTSPLPSHYDTAFLNADRNLDSLVDGLSKSGSARLCLYGPPGTGKTALGHYVAQQLDRPLLVKRASDLLSCWLGQTEKNLAEAFREASDEDAVLLIDEADSFLQDRSGAERSWEITQVNEMLTQMESFEGLFIASTNLVDSLDAASLRRFDFKVRFDFLRRHQRRALFLRLVADHATADDLILRRLDQLDLLVPGDFANVLRQLNALGDSITPSGLLHGLEMEVQLKPDNNTRRIGFR